MSYKENVNNSLQSLSGPYRIKRQMKCMMIWGMLLPDGYIHLERLKGRIDSRKYIKMMKKVKPFIEQRMNGKDYLFQQDNCSVHKSKLSMEWLENNNIDVISWPARSCDLNIIENVWHLLELVVYEKRQYIDKDTIWNVILEANDELMNKLSNVLIRVF